MLPEKATFAAERPSRPVPVGLLATLLLLAGLAGCSGLRKVKPLKLEKVPAAIEESQRELDAGESAGALKDMHRASVTSGLSTEQRGTVRQLLERAGLQRIEELREPPKPAKLAKLVKIGLPRQIAVRAGIIGAQLYLDAGKRAKAFRLIERVDENYPNHNQRREAGRIVGDIGFSFAEDNGRYALFFKYRNKAPQVLEYLVDNYPSESRTDRAYWTLGELYEAKKRWVNAIESLEDLIVWRPDSPHAIEAQAHIPHLRLRGLASPEYDRHELLRARAELEAWLERHAGNPLEVDVQTDLTDCVQRLADSDLSIARFYRKVRNPDGAIFHARRALEEARAVGNEGQAREASAMLQAMDMDADGGTGW